MSRRLTGYDAREILRNAHIPLDCDFHKLYRDQVEALLAAANRRGYRKPKNANGSRGRYFHAYLLRQAGKSE